MTSGLREEAIVAVFGDLGRSPRMLNHARELLGRGYMVRLIGYRGEIDADLLASANVKCHFVRAWSFARIAKGVPVLGPAIHLFLTIVRTLLLASNLLFIFGQLLTACKRAPRLMIVQTPPVLPLLLLAPVYCLLSGARLVVDWHNLGYTLVDSKHRLLRFVYERCERILGRLCCLRSDWSYICVSKSMRKWIIANFATRPESVSVVYDRPSDKYSIFSDLERRMERDVLFDRLNIANRDSLIFVSSTSWTADEDFSVLLSAVSIADRQLGKGKDGKVRRVVLFITGKGPLRRAFEAQLRGLEFKYFEIITLWLEPEAYPRLLAAADLGISMHTSSSGVDLPMKIIDMLGSGLPVCAFYYDCLLELMEKRRFGFVFRSAEELAGVMANIASGKDQDLKSMRANIKLNPLHSWEEEWGTWYNKQIK